MINYPNAGVNLIRALLVSNARQPVACIELFNNEKTSLRQVAGYGQVIDDTLFRSSEDQVTMFAEEKIIDKHHHFYEILSLFIRSSICACIVTSRAVVGSSADVGFAGKRHCNHYPLAHTARYMMRIFLKAYIVNGSQLTLTMDSMTRQERKNALDTIRAAYKAALNWQ